MDPPNMKNAVSKMDSPANKVEPPVAEMDPPVAKVDLSVVQEDPQAAKLDRPVAKVEPPVPALSCNICQTGFSGPESAKQHYASQKHKKQAMGVQMGQQSGRVYDFDGKKGRCFICCVAFTSQEDADQHLQGKKHKLQENRLKFCNEKRELPDNQEDKIMNTPAIDETDNLLSQTKMANLSVSGCEIMKNYLKENNARESTECLEEFVFDKTTNTGYCNLCSVSLTSYNHAYQHLNGAPHQKKRIRKEAASLKSKSVAANAMIEEAVPQKTGLPDRKEIRHDSSPGEANQNLLQEHEVRHGPFSEQVNQNLLTEHGIRNDLFSEQANQNLLPEHEIRIDPFSEQANQFLLPGQPNSIMGNRQGNIEPISYDDNMQYSGFSMETAQQSSKILQHVLRQNADQINQFQFGDDQQPKNFTANMYDDVTLPEPVSEVIEESPDLPQDRLTNTLRFSGTPFQNVLTELYDLSQSADNDEFAFDCLKNNGYCKLCDIALTSDTNATQHLVGERHQRKKLRINPEQLSQELKARQPTQQPQYNVVQVSREKATQPALPGDGSKTTLKRTKQSNDKPFFALNTDVVDIDRTVWHNCDVCQKPLNSLQQLEIHKNSPRHKKQEAKVNATRLLYPDTFERNLQNSIQRLEELTVKSKNDLSQSGGGDSDGTTGSKSGNQLSSNEVNPIQESQHCANSGAGDYVKTAP